MFRAFGTIIVISFILSVWFFYTMYKTRSYHELELIASSIQRLNWQMQASEKEFLTTEVKQETFYQTNHSTCHDKIQASALALQQLLGKLETSSFYQEAHFATAVQQLRENSERYVLDFDTLIASVRERGFKDYGKVGQLRSAIHQVESMPYDYDQAEMLMLRRHEKDFLLRQDLRYLTKFDEAFIGFRKGLAGSLNTSVHQQDSVAIILSWVDEYRDLFHQVVEAEKLIGFDQQSGVLAELNQTVRATEEAAQTIETLVQERSNRERDLARFILLGLFIVQLIAGIGLALVFSRKLSQRIRGLQQHIQVLSQGKIPPPIAETANDELADAVNSLNQLSDGITRYAEFARSIGQGVFENGFLKLSEEDQLGESLLQMSADLKSVQQREQQRSFVMNGVAAFTKLIRQQSDSFYDSFLSQLVKKINATQGGLFIRATDAEGGVVLNLEACYAWGRKKYVHHTIFPGVGMSGQVFLEKEPALITEIPADYFQIKSGLGESQPGCLLILPLKVEEQVCGILELASFQVFTEHEIELAEKGGEVLAAEMINRQNQIAMKALYQEAHTQTKALSAQEEAMRQNNEELLATQEEMKLQEQQYLRQISELESQLTAISEKAE